MRADKRPNVFTDVGAIRFLRNNQIKAAPWIVGSLLKNREGAHRITDQ